jgi:hypothetical protein
MQRFRIETFFAAQKSRGVPLHTSHMADSRRLAHLLVAACLAYIWIVYRGTLCLQADLYPYFLRFGVAGRMIQYIVVRSVRC